MAHAFRTWLKNIRVWIAKLLGKSAPSGNRSTIIREFESEHIRLLLLAANYEDEGVLRIRTWRCIFRAQNWKHDLLIVCDRIKQTRTARELHGTKLCSTHRFAVFRVSRMVVGGKLRSDCLLIADLDCVGFSMHSRGLDGFAPQIADSIAAQLKHRSERELGLLTSFENDAGVEIPGERLKVQARWLSVLRAYHLEYLPVSAMP